MNWLDYQKAALTTESLTNLWPTAELEYEKDCIRKTRMLHAVIGLVTETNELIDRTDTTNMIEEVGDCWWYLAIAYDVFGTTPPISDDYVSKFFSSPYQQGAAIRHMRIAANDLLDKVAKRHIFYSKSWDFVAGDIIELLNNYVVFLADLSIIPVCEIWEANIKKLAKRYPDGRFDSFLSTNRDVENELSHIEEVHSEPSAEPVSDHRLMTDNVGWEGFKTINPNFEWGDNKQPADELITKLEFEEILEGMLITKLQYMFAGWANKVAESYANQNMQALNDGWKTVYTKLLAKAESTINDGWGVYCQLIHMKMAPNTTEGFKEWLQKQASK